MFIRRNRNRSGSVSIQLVEKRFRKNRIVKTVGIAHSQREEELLYLLAKSELAILSGVQGLFIEHDDLVVESFVEGLSGEDIQSVGAELVLGKIYRAIGFPEGGSCRLFKPLVLCRIVYPGSKLRMVDYFKKHLNLDVSVYTVYRFMDELSSGLKNKLEDIAFCHTKSLLGGQMGVVFYDMTTLYFEASEEDDFRVTGFSKDGKHQHPQIMIGLLISDLGYPVGYQLFEGNTSETKTLIPVLEAFQHRFDLQKPVVVADAALLSQKNIDALVANGYQYILGGRLKNESESIKSEVLALKILEAHPAELSHRNGRLIITYSDKRARKDRNNREKGLTRLEKRVKSGKLTKEHINNRGYNKYLRLSGKASIRIDYQMFAADIVWDGLKGYITNTSVEKSKVIEHYGHLWQIEKAFRISKTDLRIRPVFHRIKTRIESHISICFAAYTVFKELERLLLLNNTGLSPQKAIDEIKDIRQLNYKLPKSRTYKSKLLKLNQNQQKLLNMKI